MLAEETTPADTVTGALARLHSTHIGILRAIAHAHVVERNGKLPIDCRKNRRGGPRRKVVKAPVPAEEVTPPVPDDAERSSTLLSTPSIDDRDKT
jgi:hypothetical protein